MSPRSIGFALIAALLAGCASSGHQQASGTSASSSASGEQVVTIDQLRSTAAANVYDALAALDPQLLNGRGRGAPDVYVGSIKQTEGIDRLKAIALTRVRTVTVLRYDQAKHLPDQQSSGGAIVVALQ
jgi:hypothetical protein